MFDMWTRNVLLTAKVKPLHVHHIVKARHHSDR